MRERSSIAGGVLCALVLAAPATAQTLAEGRWTGTISPPNGRTFEIWYEVEAAGDSLIATMFIPQPDGANAISLEDLGFDDEGTLGFAYRGGEIRCHLSPLEPSGYAGDCVSESRPGAARLTMHPSVKRGE